MQTPTAYSTFVDLVCDRAQTQPDQIAFTFLKNGESVQNTVTYGELDQRARAIAAVLQAKVQIGHTHQGLTLPHRALLVYPYDAGLEFITAFLGCLYAGIIAVPSHPPRNRRATSDILGRMVSASVSLALTPKSMQAQLKRQIQQADETAELPSCEWLATDDITTTTASDWQRPNIQGNHLAFLQYTSGSTGLPKGVMIDHNSLMYNQRLLAAAFGHSQDLVGVGWLPLFHDMGLIGNVLQSLYMGTPCVLMSPIAFIQKPVRWLQAISRYRATTSGGPNFAYDLLCRHVTAAQLENLDLSAWDVAFSGAEPVRPGTLEKFTTKFSPCGFRPEAFYPCYGMAEATLFITGGQKTEHPEVCYVDERALSENRVVWRNTPQANGQAPERALVSCGWSWLDQQIVIVDPETCCRCAPDQIGEIWVNGKGLGKGYWKQPQQTEQTFQAYTADTNEGPFLRTGDLGFAHGGKLFITGRRNDVLVFWGLNHYPQHLEHTVETCHPGFRTNSNAAFAVPVNGCDRLVIAQEVERRYRNKLTTADVIESVRWALFNEHFVDVYTLVLLKPGSIPKTSSGKVQRSRCRELFLAGEWDYLDKWRSPNTTPGAVSPSNPDIPSLMRRYLNPSTHLKRYGRHYWSLVKAKLWSRS